MNGYFWNWIMYVQKMNKTQKGSAIKKISYMNSREKN